MQLWWWKATLPMVTPSIAHQLRSQQTTAINKYILQGISFLLGCVDFLERSIAPSASRRSHIPLCCGIWFMSSALSLALGTQTVLLLYAFVLVHPVVLFHKNAQIVALLIHSFGSTSTQKAEDRLRHVLHTWIPTQTTSHSCTTVVTVSYTHLTLPTTPYV